MRLRAAQYIACTLLLASCSFVGGNPATRDSVKIADVINKVKADLRAINLRQFTSNDLACGSDAQATLSLTIRSVTLSLQDTVVVDKTIDASGKSVPVFGIPISPSIGTEAKTSDGNEVDVSFGPVTLPNENPAPGGTDSKLNGTGDQQLAMLIDSAVNGVLHADHKAKPCLPVNNQTLTVTRTFEVVKTDQIANEFGFKVLYSAGFKASHATDAKNTITVKLLMIGTPADAN
jgi:hypothetical protein